MTREPCLRPVGVLPSGTISRRVIRWLLSKLDGDAAQREVEAPTCREPKGHRGPCFAVFVQMLSNGQRDDVCLAPSRQEGIECTRRRGHAGPHFDGYYWAEWAQDGTAEAAARAKRREALEALGEELAPEVRG